MAHAFALFGWFIFNVAIPLLAPLALLPLARFAEFSHARSNGIVRRSVENGQLLWAAIPMSAAGCHGLAGWIDQATGGRQLAWSLLAANVALIVAGSVLVMLGSLHSAPRRRRRQQRGTNRILQGSIAISLASAIATSVAHATLISKHC